MNIYRINKRKNIQISKTRRYALDDIEIRPTPPRIWCRATTPPGGGGADPEALKVGPVGSVIGATTLAVADESTGWGEAGRYLLGKGASEEGELEWEETVLAREKKEGGVGERENRLRDKDGRERVAKKISRPDGGSAQFF